MPEDKRTHGQVGYDAYCALIAQRVPGTETIAWDDLGQLMRDAMEAQANAARRGPLAAWTTPLDNP